MISGLPRSGTSWTGKALSFAPGYTYYREPDNSDHVAAAPPKPFWDLYLKSGGNCPAFTVHMESAVRGKIATNFTMQEDPGPIIGRLPRRFRWLGEFFPSLYLRQPNALVKFVRANLSLDWIGGRFPDARIVSLVRHPVGQFASFQKLGWGPMPQELLANDQLVEEHLAPFVDLISKAETFWQRAGALWGAINLVIYRQAKSGAAHSVVPFEWLCMDTSARMRELSLRLGMEWTKAAETFVAPTGQGTEGAAFSLERDSRAQIDKWCGVIPEQAIAECRAFAEPFELPVYKNFDPWDAAPLWGPREMAVQPGDPPS